LKRLLVKCTTPVSAMAISMGKKNTNTGVRIVPSPNPEKNVRMAVKKAAIDIIIISIVFVNVCLIQSYILMKTENGKISLDDGVIENAFCETE
jgi:hypothetical protein